MISEISNRVTCYIVTSYILLLGLIFILLAAGCSSSKSGNPISPSSDFNQLESISEIPSAIRTGANSYMGMFGLYDLSINPAGNHAEIVPLRLSETLGEQYVVDIVSFLNISPCTDCVRIMGIELEPDGTITVNIGIRHPFPLPVDMDNPQNNERLDLHIFDVQGILVLDGDFEFPLTVSDINADCIYEESVVSSRDILRNADGYTSIFDSFYDTIFPTTSNIHPFKLFARDGSEGNYNPDYDPLNGFPFLDNPTGHNVFRQACPGYIVGYNFALTPGINYNFLFALSASYGHAGQGKGTELGKRNNPRYFLPEFNRKEPWMVTCEITNSNLAGHTPSSYADLDIKIRDWQNNLTMNPAFDFMTSSLRSISRESSIRNVTLEVPGMSLMLNEYTLPVPTGNGSDTSPLRYQLRIYNEGLVPEGIYHGLVTARDDLEGTVLSIGIERDGVTIFPVNDFSTYQVFTLNVAPADFPPVSIITTIPDPPAILETNQPITFDGSLSTDDGTIMSYEWDFDYNGSNYDFHVDRTGVSVDFSYPVPGFYTAALRVTDNHSPPQQAIGLVNVSVFCNTFTVGACPINERPTWLVTSHYEDWETLDGKIDFGFLSNGDAIIEDNEILGRANVSPGGGAAFIPFISNYPGVNVGSIDIDREDRVIWVQYHGPDAVIIGGLESRNTEYGNVVHVFDTVANSEIAAISLDSYCNYIQAIDTDEGNNVWVIMEGNKTIKLRASDFTAVQSNIYELNDIAGENIGLVFDLAIDFHNDCYYVLTDSDDKGALYRFECDLTFQPFVNGNPNPLDEVFDMIGGFQIIETFGDDALADIEIDNFAGQGYDTILNGEQDCQIVMFANGLLLTTQIYASRTVVNADLEILAQGLDSTGFGTHAIAINPDGTNHIYSIVYGNSPYLPPGCSDKEMDVYMAPMGWL